MTDWAEEAFKAQEKVADLNAELDRHHRDFVSIVKILDEAFEEYEEGELMEVRDAMAYLRSIRNIVG